MNLLDVVGCTMNVRFKKRTAKADEDKGTARLVARARKEITSGVPLIPKKIADRIAKKCRRSRRSER